MPITQTDVNLINVIVSVLPDILALIKAAQQSQQPGQPVPTDAQVIAALLQGAAASIAVDEAWKAAHPA